MFRHMVVCMCFWRDATRSCAFSRKEYFQSNGSASARMFFFDTFQTFTYLSKKVSIILLDVSSLSCLQLYIDCFGLPTDNDAFAMNASKSKWKELKTVESKILRSRHNFSFITIVISALQRKELCKTTFEQGARFTLQGRILGFNELSLREQFQCT